VIPIRQLRLYRKRTFTKSALDVRPADGDLAFFAKSLLRRVFRDDIGGSAAQAAYYVLFSIPPLLLFANALLGLLHWRDDMTGWLMGVLFPQEVIDLLEPFSLDIVGGDVFPLVAGLATGLFCFSRAVKYLLLALNRAYRIRPPRATVRAGILSVLFTAVLMCAMLIIVVLSVVGSSLLSFVLESLGVYDFWLLEIWELVRWLMIGALLLATLALLYSLVPGSSLPPSSAVPGTLFAFAAWFVCSFVFSFYVNNIGNYSILYGSIGAMIVFMLWLFMTMNIIILGGHLNHTLICLRRRRQERRA